VEQQWRTMTVDERYAHRVGLANLVDQVRRPFMVVLFLVCIPTVVLAVLSSDVLFALLMIAMLLVIQAMAYVSCRRATARALPVGSTLGTALAPHALLLRDATAAVDVPYDSVTATVTRRDMVKVKRRRMRALLVPRELLPDEDRARLLDLARYPSSAPAPVPAVAAGEPVDPDALVRWVVVDRTYAWAATRAVLRASLASRAGAGSLVFLALVMVAAGVIAGPVQGGVISLVTAVLLALVIRRSAARHAPTGTWILVVVGADGLLTESANLRALSPWSQLGPVQVRRHVVVVPMRTSAGVRVLPRAGLDDEVIAALRRGTGT